MAVVDAYVGGGGGGKDLALIFEAVIGLSDGDGEVTGEVRLEVSVPEKAIRAADASPEATIERAIA